MRFLMLPDFGKPDSHQRASTGTHVPERLAGQSDPQAAGPQASISGHHSNDTPTTINLFRPNSNGTYAQQ